MRRCGITLVALLWLCVQPAQAAVQFRLHAGTNDFVIPLQQGFEGEALVVSQGLLRMEGFALRDLWLLSTFGKPVEIAPAARLAGDVRFCALAGTFSGSAAGNVMGLLYGAFRLAPEGKIGGDLVVYADNIVCEGAVQGDAIIIGKTVTLGGSWGGRVRVQAEELRVAPGTIFGGNLEYVAPRPPVLDASVQVKGELKQREYLFAFLAPQQAGPDMAVRMAAAGRRFFGGLLTGVVVLWLFPGFIGLASWHIRAMPVRTLFAGFGVFWLAPMLVVFTFFLFGGIPLALMMAAFHGILLYLSHIVLAIWLGGMLMAVAKKKPRVFTALFLGLFLLHAAMAIPMVAPLVITGSVLFGFGALILTLFSRPPFPTRFIRRMQRPEADGLNPDSTDPPTQT